jgi:hypothetical protein
MPRTTLEVRWSSFLIKRLSGVSPDGDAGGGVVRWQNRLRLDQPLEFLVQPLDHYVAMRSPPRPPISQLTSPLNQIASSGWNSHHIPGGTSALSCNH